MAGPFALALAGAFALAEGFPQWRNLESGPFAVGFDVIAYYDHDRSYESGDDAPRARPLPIHVWYPAVVDPRASVMRYRDYVHLRAAEDDLAPLTPEKRRWAESWFAEYSGAPGSTAAEIENVLSLESRAQAGANPEDGAFSLVLYAPGYSEGVHENTVLAEYLASYGLVVAMTPMRGLLGREDDDDMTGIQAQVEDLGAMYARLRNDRRVSGGGLGVMGFDEGGLAAVLFSLRHTGVEAVVALDGYVGYRDDETRTRFPHFDGARMRAAYLQLVAGVMKRDRDPSRFSFDFYDSVRRTPAYSVRLLRMAHDDFTSDHLVSYVHTGRDETTFPVDDIDESYALMCRYVRAFLTSTFEEDDSAREYLKGPAHEWIDIRRHEPAR